MGKGSKAEWQNDQHEQGTEGAQREEEKGEFCREREREREFAISCA